MQTGDSLLRPLVARFVASLGSWELRGVLFGVSLLGSPATHFSGLSAMKMRGEQSQPRAVLPQVPFSSPAREALLPAPGKPTDLRGKD